MLFNQIFEITNIPWRNLSEEDFMIQNFKRIEYNNNNNQILSINNNNNNNNNNSLKIQKFWDLFLCK